MPCTLEPWEVEWEERQANKRKYGIDLADHSLTTKLLCEVSAKMEALDIPLSREHQLWFDAHRQQDAKKQRLDYDQARHDAGLI